MIDLVVKLSSLFEKYSMNTNISLTSTEDNIFSLLKEVIKNKTPDTILRVAGGWIRDKLMGKTSNDIDVAISNMTGEKFANIVNEYMREKGLKTHEISVVQSNPDQSKHLATAMVRLFGLPIDFVNLRTETYADSRIPQIETGTPEEDSKRRDLTINALFYNINTDEIEDFVGGLKDLKAGIARTPMDPVQTFLDDPLRILRTVRFAARYGLKLDPGIINAAHNPDVKEAFKKKMSQERIWAELAGKKEGDKWKPGALIGQDPTGAMSLLKQLGLLELIFDPTEEEMRDMGLSEQLVPWDTEQNNPHHNLNIWGHTLSVVKNLVDQTKQPIKEEYETYLVRNLAGLLHDIGKRYQGVHGTNESGHTTYHGHEELSGQLAETILNRLKAPKDIIKRVKLLIDSHMRTHGLLDEGVSEKAYRKYTRELGDEWEHGIDLGAADALGKEKMSPEQIASETGRYETLRNNIRKALPGGQTVMARPISGNDIIGLGIKKGPIIGQIMKLIDDKLLENPALSKEEALEIARQYIKINKQAGKKKQKKDEGGQVREWPGPHGPMISKNPDLGSGPYSQNNGLPYGGKPIKDFIKKQRKRRYKAKGKKLAMLDELTRILYNEV